MNSDEVDVFLFLTWCNVSLWTITAFDWDVQLFSWVLLVPRIANQGYCQEQLLSDVYPCCSESWASVQESRADADVEPLPQSGVLKS